MSIAVHLWPVTSVGTEDVGWKIKWLFVHKMCNSYGCSLWSKRFAAIAGVRAETCVGLHLKVLAFGFIVRFLIRCLNWPILGPNLVKIVLTVPEFPRAERQTDIADVVGIILDPPPKKNSKSKNKII